MSTSTEPAKSAENITESANAAPKSASVKSKYLKRIDVAFVLNGKHFHKVLRTNAEYQKMLELLLEALRQGDKIENYLVMQKNELSEPILP